MLTTEKISLTNINKIQLFKDIIEKLTLDENLNYEERVYILTCAILFIKHYQEDNRYTSYADIAYYLILKYSLKYADYKPLYDFSVNFGFYPVTKSLLTMKLIDENSIHESIIDFKLDKFKNETNDIETLEQNIKSKKFLNDTVNETSYLAPTSFGKSSLIIKYIRQLDVNLKIVIVVPTKSLLMQTYRMVKAANLQRKIIIHDEMYDDESSLIAIFTQERSLRLMERKQISYDVLFIDEAHNILKKDSRSIFLSRLIAKNRNRNPNHKVIYLSPLIRNVDNIKITNEQEISSHIINFNVKEPEIFEYRLNKEVYKYNRFVNEFYLKGNYVNKFEYILERSGKKNFVYNYRPIKIEQLAEELCENLSQVSNSQNINEIVDILTREVHPDFYAIKYIKYGVVYLHGKLPDLIKEYLEYKYKELDEIKYVIANSVILEGMNLPIDTLFIFNTRALYGKELMNLIGRVNRLNEIFSTDEINLNKLLPNIHFINNEEHNNNGSNMMNKIKLLRSRIFDDLIENPTLNAFDIDKLKITKDRIEDYRIKVNDIQENERFLYSQSETELDIFKKKMIESGLNAYYDDFNVVSSEILAKIQSILNEDNLDWNFLTMMEKIEFLFIHNNVKMNDFEISRLINEKARNYYENFILNSQKNSLKQNIVSQFQYFKDKAQSDDKLLYFGGAYGEVSYETGTYTQNANNIYVDLSTKSDAELINLAVVKLKMEEDFVSFKLNRFIVMMYDYNVISLDEYNLYIYGTTDEHKISLTKYGLNISLISRLERDSQLSNLSFDTFNNLQGNSQFKEFLRNVDDFYRFEINRYLN